LTEKEMPRCDRDGMAPACLRLGRVKVCWRASHSAARIKIRMFPEVKLELEVRREKRAMRDAKKPRFGIVVDVHPSVSGGIICTSRRVWYIWQYSL
jgi:hypothetical protein